MEERKELKTKGENMEKRRFSDSGQRFDMQTMAEQEECTLLDNLLFEYQEELGLDFADIGIICKICSFSPDSTINFSKHFSSMSERTRTARLKKLTEKGYITTVKVNIKIGEVIRSKGLKVSIEPLVEILNGFYTRDNVKTSL